MADDFDAKFKRSAQRLQKASMDFKDVVKSIESPKYMKELGDFAAKMIKTRTRLGDSVDKQGADKKKLKPLSDEYVEQRRKDKANGDLSEFTTPKKSNLTRTGQLLDSISAKSPTARTVKVGPTGQRDDGKTNQQIGEFVSDAGRPFNNLSNIELKRIHDRIRLDVKAMIKKRLIK